MQRPKEKARCGHCGARFSDDFNLIPLAVDEDAGWMVEHHLCPYCNRLTVQLLSGQPTYDRTSGAFDSLVANPLGGQSIRSELVRPPKTFRAPCPSEVVSESPAIAEDYTEACLIVADSPKASAALSRRCLQHLLRDKAGVKSGDLANEIQQVLDSKTLPSHLATQIDAVRNIGNFAAHPMKSTNSGDILPVEPEEAEWNLDVLEGLFDFYYVQPAKSAAKIAALNQKLGQANKPPIKKP